MITGDIKSRIDQVWNAFWAGGIANPLEVIEQITYLLFIRRLDDLQTLEENKANRLKQSIQRRIFPEGKDGKQRAYEDCRWSRFKHFAPADMFEVVGEHIFPYLRTGLAQQLGNGESTYAHHMKDARFFDEAHHQRLHVRAILCPVLPEVVGNGGVRRQSAGVRPQRRTRLDDPSQCPQVR